jgi:Tfp pilus assembly protein PilF
MSDVLGHPNTPDGKVPRRFRLKRPLLRALAGPTFFCVVLLGPWLVAHGAETAQESGGTNQCVLLTVEGMVELKLRAATNWITATAGSELNPGDQLRTGTRSRASLRLSNLAVLRVNAQTTLEVRSATATATTPMIDLKAGSSYFFNRTRPMETQFRTPTVTGAIRGTEFLLEVAESGVSTVSMFDGEVLLENEAGQLSIHNHEQAVVRSGEPPTKTAVVLTQRLIQWVLYYPAVLDPTDLFTAHVPAQLMASIEAYRAGDLLKALRLVEGSPETAAERSYLAALLLSVGQVGESERLLAEVGQSSEVAAALRVMIATVRGDDELQPISHPTTATEWLAMSYYYQSRNELEPARKAAREVVRLAPGLGSGWARLAELEFGFGDLKATRRALDQASALSPRNAQAAALSGFVLTAEGNTEKAVQQFDEAIALDGALGNAWLGRGLARFFAGDREPGRADLQVAATLEPQRSLLRSYLAKGFAETRDLKHAESELALARQLDPNDPTPLLYSALLRQQQNRINEAVADLQESSRLNDHRALYRSRLLLDQDQSVRSANLAALYRDNGMIDLSVREAARSVNLDYANHSAHLFLANSYDALRDPRQINLRYETPWLSELLVANLLAPVNAAALSQTVSQQEYSRLFAGDELGFSSGTEYQSRGDWTQYGSFYGTEGRSGFAVDVLYRDLSGDAPNTDVEQFDLSAKFKQQLTAQDSVLFQAVYSDYESGDPRQYYDPTNASPTLRVKEKQAPNLFAGYHREWSPGNHTLFLAGRLSDEFTLDDSAATLLITTRNSSNHITRVDQRLAPVNYASDLEAWSFELQQVHQKTEHTLVAGGRFQTGDIDTESFIQRGAGIGQEVHPELNRASAYAYYTWQIIEPLAVTAGVSYDHLDYPANNEIVPVTAGQTSKDMWSPKAGLRWQPFDSTTFRAGYTRSLGGVFYDTSVRLEPTQIAGFNQAFRSLLPESVAGLVPGSEFETLGAAWDQKIDDQTFFSVSGELLKSAGARTVGTLDAFGPLLTDIPSGTRQYLDYEEKVLAASLDRMIGRQFVVGATYRLSEAELDDRVPEVVAAWSPRFSPTANRTVSATLHQLNLRAIFNHTSGGFGEFHSLWTSQSSRGYSPALAGDDFWQFNVFLGYRLTHRMAELRAGVLNLGDEDYRLNPLNLQSALPRERTFVISLKLNL